MSQRFPHLETEFLHRETLGQSGPDLASRLGANAVVESVFFADSECFVSPQQLGQPQTIPMEIGLSLAKQLYRGLSA